MKNFEQMPTARADYLNRQAPFGMLHGWGFRQPRYLVVCNSPIYLPPSAFDKVAIQIDACHRFPAFTVHRLDHNDEEHRVLWIEEEEIFFISSGSWERPAMQLGAIHWHLNCCWMNCISENGFSDYVPLRDANIVPDEGSDADRYQVCLDYTLVGGNYCNDRIEISE